MVVLPHPEGPRKVTNSRSTTERLTPLSAWKEPNCLPTSEISMNAMASHTDPRLARARAREPVDQRRKRKDDRDHEDRQGGDDFKLAEVVQTINRDRQRLGAAGIEQDRRTELTEGWNEHEQECHQ